MRLILPDKARARAPSLSMLLDALMQELHRRSNGRSSSVYYMHNVMQTVDARVSPPNASRRCDAGTIQALQKTLESTEDELTATCQSRDEACRC